MLKRRPALSRETSLLSMTYRTELRACEKLGSSEGSPRFVVIVEIPDHIVSTIGHPGSPRLRAKACEVAMNATWRQRVNTPKARFQEWSNSLLLDTDLTDYGEATFRATDGGRAWRVESAVTGKAGKPDPRPSPVGVSLF
jgi:hypothetical protein